MKISCFTGALCATALCAGAKGSLIDFSQPVASATVNGAVFMNTDFDWLIGLSAIVKLQNNGVEQGYNTSGSPRPFDASGGSDVNRDVRLQDLATWEIGGVPHYGFVLDVKEPAGSSARVSLDEVRLYTSPTGGQTTTSLSSLGIMRYELDGAGDRWLSLDAGVAGRMAMLVPTSAFAGASSADYVYLYSKLGDNHAAGGAGDVWSASLTPVPGPGTAALMAAGLSVMAGRRKRTQS